MNEGVSSAVLLSVTQSVGTFTALLPPLSEVRRTHNDPDVTADVRMGEVAAFSLVTAIGLVASSLVKSPAPAMVSILCAVALVVAYESVLASEPTPTKPAIAKVSATA